MQGSRDHINCGRKIDDDNKWLPNELLFQRIASNIYNILFEYSPPSIAELLQICEYFQINIEILRVDLYCDFSSIQIV